MTAARRRFDAALRQGLARPLGAGAAGAALNLAFAPIAWWPLGVLAPAALFVLIRGLPPRRAAWVGAAFGVGLFAFGTYWLYTCLHVFGLVPVWLTLVLQSIFVAVMAVFPAALCFLANRFWRKPGMTRDLLVLPALWVLLEWLRGWILSGFPWLSLGYAFIDSPLSGWAPLLGVYGVTWAAVLAAAALATGFGWLRSARIGTSPTARAAVARPPQPSQPDRPSQTALPVLPARPSQPALPFLPARSFLVLLLALQLFMVPLWLGRHAWTRATGAPLPIAVVQGAVSQELKWQIENRQATLTRYLDLTQRAWGARLVVWPESALPALANNLTDYLADLHTLAREHDADFAIGLVNYEAATERYFNGLLVMSRTDGWYYKRHLVPFGEYFPVPPFVRSWLRLMSLPYDDISAGAPQQPVLRAAGQPLGLTICYEDAFGSEQLAVLRQATLLINVTNNAWFGDSTAPHQHLQISRMRALEAGRYLVRSTNDGITAAIDPRGKIVARLPQFQEAVMRVDVQPMTGLTPYARVGNYPVVSGAMLLLGLAAWRRSGRPAGGTAG